MFSAIECLTGTRADAACGTETDGTGVEEHEGVVFGLEAAQGGALSTLDRDFVMQSNLIKETSPCRKQDLPRRIRQHP
jgi:hypothetical protein